MVASNTVGRTNPNQYPPPPRARRTGGRVQRAFPGRPPALRQRRRPLSAHSRIPGPIGAAKGKQSDTDDCLTNCCQT